uniref:Uncharacterized protein n=1 Tax=Solanum tuberosum TaxID=4113 RepID=M1CFA2_SOLTU
MESKDGVDLEKVPASERSLKSRAILARSVGGFVPDQVGPFCFIISMFGFSIVSLIDIAQLSNIKYKKLKLFVLTSVLD